MTIHFGNAFTSDVTFTKQVFLEEKLKLTQALLKETQAKLETAKAELEATKAEQHKALFDTNPGKDVALIWTGVEWLRMDKPTVSFGVRLATDPMSNEVNFSVVNSITIRSDWAYTGYIPKPAPAPALTQAEISALLGRHFAHLDATERERIAALLSVTGPASAPADGCAAEGR